MSLQDEVVALVDAARLAQTDSAQVEIKKALGGAPKSLPETVSAFANGVGGIIVLGIDEENGFVPVAVNAAALADALVSACADNVVPAVRARIEIVTVEGLSVVAAVIPPIESSLRPCYVKPQGIEHGSYIREHDGDRHLSSYEIHLMVTGRGQPQDDVVIVTDATVADLDPIEVDRLVERFRARRGEAFSRFTVPEILRMAGVCPRGGDDGEVTLAGLLALGVYPQEYYPQLNVTFVSYPTVDGRAMRDGTRFLENAALDGSIPQMVAGLLDVVRRSMTRRSVIIGAGREDIWEYPVEAVRELVVNAIMHRDYHPLALGSQVRVEMYPDRLLVINPGGLFGAFSTDQLLKGMISSSRNATLARLLEDVEIPGTNRTVCENRGSGMHTILAELAGAGMEPPILRASDGLFIAELRSQTIPTVADVRTAPVATTPVEYTRNRTPAGADSVATILGALAAGSQSTASLMTITGLSRPGVGRHLRALESQGLIQPTEVRQSPTVRWALTAGVSADGGA
ncbi:MAG: putative DNA binding domain-containing protein [Propionibacteriaceae bacterium]|nr:putative DNA binding domain-containing protein [Propionibacteriaceae bacterium]